MSQCGENSRLSEKRRNISPARRKNAFVLTRENAFALDESLEFNLLGRRITVAAASAFALYDIVDGFGRASASRRSALLFFLRRLRRRLRARRRFPFPRRGKGFFILRAFAFAVLPADFCERTVCTPKKHATNRNINQKAPLADALNKQFLMLSLYFPRTVTNWLILE